MLFPLVAADGTVPAVVRRVLGDDLQHGVMEQHRTQPWQGP